MEILVSPMYSRVYGGLLADLVPEHEQEVVLGQLGRHGAGETHAVPRHARHRGEVST